MGRFLKICVVGDSTTGKTSFILRLVENVFTDNMTATVGVDHRRHKPKIMGKEVDVQIWDVSGQDKYRNVVKNFYRESDGIIIMFSTCDEKSVLNL